MFTRLAAALCSILFLTACEQEASKNICKGFRETDCTAKSHCGMERRKRRMQKEEGKSACCRRSCGDRPRDAGNTFCRGPRPGSTCCTGSTGSRGTCGTRSASFCRGACGTGSSCRGGTRCTRSATRAPEAAPPADTPPAAEAEPAPSEPSMGEPPSAIAAAAGLSRRTRPKYRP